MALLFKYTTMGPMIPKEMKYNLHYGDVRGDVELISIQFGRNVSLVTLYQDCSSQHDSSRTYICSPFVIALAPIFIDGF